MDKEHQTNQIKIFVQFLTEFGSVETLTEFPAKGYITLAAPTWNRANIRDIVTFAATRPGGPT